MPVLPTLAQNLYFYGAIAAFLVFAIAVAYGLISTATLPTAKPAPKRLAQPSGDDLAHAR